MKLMPEPLPIKDFRGSIDMDAETGDVAALYLSPVKFAELTGLSLDTVYACIGTGKLPARRIRGRWFIEPTHVTRMQEGE